MGYRMLLWEAQWLHRTCKLIVILPTSGAQTCPYDVLTTWIQPAVTSHLCRVPCSGTSHWAYAELAWASTSSSYCYCLLSACFYCLCSKCPKGNCVPGSLHTGEMSRAISKWLSWDLNLSGQNVCINHATMLPKRVGFIPSWVAGHSPVVTRAWGCQPILFFPPLSKVTTGSENLCSLIQLPFWLPSPGLWSPHWVSTPIAKIRATSWCPGP
jgi:hypothetical protein